jgi:hypothetical protein
MVTAADFFRQRIGKAVFFAITVFDVDAQQCIDCVKEGICRFMNR